MRTFLIICPFLAGIGGAISQNLNFAEHGALDRTGNMVSINSKVFYLGGYASGSTGMQIYITGRDKNGITLFSKGLHGSGNHQLQGFSKVISTLDKALLVNYWTIKSCDQAQQTDFITKLDTNGNTLFSVPIQSSSVSGFNGTIKDITQHPDSSYYLCSNTELYHYSSTGVFISKIATGLTDLFTLKALNNGKLFLHGKVNGNNTNVIMLSNGTIIKQMACTNPITKTFEIANHYFCRSLAGVIEKYDTTLTLVDSFDANISPANYLVNDFTTRNDSLFVVGNYFNGGVLYYTILDTALNQLYQDITTYKGISPTGIAITNANSVNVISTCFSNSFNQYKYTFSGFFQFKINSGFKAKSDIGVITFKNLNTWLDLNQGYTIFPTINMDVIVKNFGIDTVKNFYINSLASFFCGYSLLHKECNMTIAPGETVSIPTGLFYGQTFSSSSTISSKNINICVFTSIPNNSNDIEINNDSYCDSVLFTTTGINEISLLEQNIQIYPNPFNSSFTVQSDTEMNGYALYNSMGALIREEKIQAKEITLNQAGFAAGIYFIKIKTEKGIVSKKIVKEN